jgi:hypothetical protein
MFGKFGKLHSQRRDAAAMLDEVFHAALAASKETKRQRIDLTSRTKSLSTNPATRRPSVVSRVACLSAGAKF